MIGKIFLGTAAALLIAGPASALTMTPNTDSRTIQAAASVGQDIDTDSDSPSSDFLNYSNSVSAHAGGGIIPGVVKSSINSPNFFAPTADASASQESVVGPFSISGTGSATASGGHGALLQTGTVTFANGTGPYAADASSVLEILFSIDASAAFDLKGFLSAGDLQTGDLTNINDVIDVSNVAINNASVLLKNLITNEIIFAHEVSDDLFEFDEQGVIGAGDYLFSVVAMADVSQDRTVISGDAVVVTVDNPLPPTFFEPHTRFEASLELNPIPEPVTASLSVMGLGALLLRTSRRRA